MTDQELIEFKEIYRRNIDSVYQTAFIHMKNRSDAEDAVQTVFMKYITLKPVFKNPVHEKAWFIVAVRNHCRDMLRSWWLSGRTESDSEKTEEFFRDREDGYITEAVLRLPKKYRELIHLYYYEEYSNSEIARMLGINESTVRSRMMRARDRLKRIIEKEKQKNE